AKKNKFQKNRALFATMYYLFRMSLPPFETLQAFMSRRRALFPRDVFLRSVTSWYHSSNRSRSEFVRQLTAAFGISWSKKNAGASWFRDRHRRSTPNNSPCAEHTSLSRAIASAPRSRSGDRAVAGS